MNRLDDRSIGEFVGCLVLDLGQLVGWNVSGTVGGLVLVVCLVGWFVSELCVSFSQTVCASVGQSVWLVG